jgi:hypothetical protein
MMNETLRVSLESPQHGFMSLRLSSDAESFVAVVSHAPYDSLRDLMTALSAALAGDADAVVRWNGEPEEFDFRLSARNDRLRLDIIRYPDHRRAAESSEAVFSFDGRKLEVCHPLWKELRDLRRRTARDEFDRQWRSAFPESEMQELTKSIRAFKHEATP